MSTSDLQWFLPTQNGDFAINHQSLLQRTTCIDRLKVAPWSSYLRVPRGAGITGWKPWGSGLESSRILARMENRFSQGQLGLRWYVCSGEDAQRSPGKPMLTDNAGQLTESWESQMAFLLCTSFPFPNCFLNLFHYLSQCSSESCVFRSHVCFWFEETLIYQYFSGVIRYVKVGQIERVSMTYIYI